MKLLHHFYSTIGVRPSTVPKAFCSRIKAFHMEPQRAGDRKGCDAWRARR